jgi:hypothetical protein
LNEKEETDIEDDLEIEGFDDALDTMSTEGLKRPPEDQCIKTVEDLKAAFPGVTVVQEEEGEFQKFLKNHENFPTEKECAKLKLALTAEKKAARKRRSNVPNTNKQKRGRTAGKNNTKSNK